LDRAGRVDLRFFAIHPPGLEPWRILARNLTSGCPRATIRRRNSIAVYRAFMAISCWEGPPRTPRAGQPQRLIRSSISEGCRSRRDRGHHVPRVVARGAPIAASGWRRSMWAGRDKSAGLGSPGRPPSFSRSDAGSWSISRRACGLTAFITSAGISQRSPGAPAPFAEEQQRRGSNHPVRRE
jgi:hypothetical protein